MRQAANHQGSSARTAGSDDENVRIEIDPYEADPSKAVARVRADDDALSLSGDDGDGGKEQQFDQRIGKVIQKRLNRLSRNMNRSFQQQRAEDEARHQREIAALRGRDQGLQVDRSAGSDSAHEAEMTALQTQLELASEKGDSKEVARITRVMSQKDAQYWATKQAKVSLAEAPRAAREAAPVRQQDQPADKDPRLTDEAKKWLKANADWWEDDDYRPERSMALTIDEDLDNEGLDRDSPEYFQELSKRLKAKCPALEVAGLPAAKKNGKARKETKVQEEDDSNDFNPRGAPVVSHQDRGDAPSGRRSQRVSLTREQIGTMRSMGMDPDNNEDVLTYWEESRLLTAQESED